MAWGGTSAVFGTAPGPATPAAALKLVLQARTVAFPHGWFSPYYTNCVTPQVHDGGKCQYNPGTGVLAPSIINAADGTVLK
jgi:hypothetical protein